MLRCPTCKLINNDYCSNPIHVGDLASARERVKLAGEPSLSELIEKFRKLEQVGWQQRYIDPEEGPSIWTFCDETSYNIIKNRLDYEVRPVFVVK